MLFLCWRLPSSLFEFYSITLLSCIDHFSLHALDWPQPRTGEPQQRPVLRGHSTSVAPASLTVSSFHLIENQSPLISAQSCRSFYSRRFSPLAPLRCPVNPSFFSDHPAHFPLFTSVQDHRKYLFVYTYDFTSHHFLTSLNSLEQKIKARLNPGSLYNSIPAAEYD